MVKIKSGKRASTVVATTVRRHFLFIQKGEDGYAQSSLGEEAGT